MCCPELPCPAQSNLASLVCIELQRPELSLQPFANTLASLVHVQWVWKAGAELGRTGWHKRRAVSQITLLLFHPVVGLQIMAALHMVDVKSYHLSILLSTTKHKWLVALQGFRLVYFSALKVVPGVEPGAFCVQMKCSRTESHLLPQMGQLFTLSQVFFFACPFCRGGAGEMDQYNQ